MKSALKLMILILALVGISWTLFIFHQENLDPVRLYLGAYRTRELPLGALVMGIFVIGLLMGGLIFFSVVMSVQFERRRLRKEIEALQRVLSVQSNASSASAGSTTPARQSS